LYSSDFRQSHNFGCLRHPRVLGGVSCGLGISPGFFTR
jgi:hypothetical protein